MMTPDSTNEMFHLAVQLVNQSARSIFLTGKAGTGKTTFLKYIRENCPRQMAVVAPTGVAAINAGGVTIHSFFQLPFSPFVPDIKGAANDADEVVSRHTLINRLRINREKIKLLRQLELLVIDEISMVRCDTMDAIDTVLRHVRKRPFERFGGVQLLLIGDMFQLPPVIKDPEWRILSEFYASPYFFDSLVIRDEPPLYIEFNKIYRQADEQFIRVLNQVRNNALDEEGITILEKCFRPGFHHSKEDGYILLTTHNETARKINATELVKLDTPAYTYNAEIKGDFPNSAFPADEKLQLKAGAQVMFIKNDSDRGKRYFNGKIGIVTELGEDSIKVRCKDDDEEIEVGKETWENIRYTLNKTTRQMDDDVLGSFAQYPLRLAWAITIHKSQGLTFDKAIIDAGEAFAPGQVYVALSRCTSLEGLVLQSRVRAGSLFTDERIVSFSKSRSDSDRVKSELDAARKNYREKLLVSAFEFGLIANTAAEIKEYIAENNTSFSPGASSWADTLLQKVNTVRETAEKFHSWLLAQFQLPATQEDNPVVKDKAAKAATYFVSELEKLVAFIEQPDIATDSKLHAKEFNDSLRELFAEVALKKYMLHGFGGQIEPEKWHERRKSFVLPAFSINVYGGTTASRNESPHPLLYQQLKKLRDAICDRKNVPIYLVASSSTLEELVRYLPQSLSELKMIAGFGDARIKQYGQEFLDVILEYCVSRDLVSLIHEKSTKKERKEKASEKRSRPDTKAESYKLFLEGKTVAEIAGSRGLTIQTVEGHLAHYVAMGSINIEALVGRDKIARIESLLADHEGKAITPIKEKAGNDISFGEIRLVIAWKSYLDRSSDTVNS